MPDVLRLGTRRSPLALSQSRQVAVALMELHRETQIELVPISTRGDRTPGDLAEFGGKGLFTREIEQRLLDGEIDLAVHSLKDLPVRQPDGLRLAAFPIRADARDALLSAGGGTIEDLPAGGVVLTGSLRRRAHLLHLRPDLRVEPVRGNVETRIDTWRASGHAGLVLAMAGIERLGLTGVPLHALDPEVFLPAPGQGILAVQTRAGCPTEALCRALDHPPTATIADAERRIVAAFGGDCSLPLAAWATIDSGSIHLRALIATPDGKRRARGEAMAADPQATAEACLDAMRSDGAERVVAALGR